MVRTRVGTRCIGCGRDGDGCGRPGEGDAGCDLGHHVQLRAVLLVDLGQQLDVRGGDGFAEKRFAVGRGGVWIHGSVRPLLGGGESFEERADVFHVCALGERGMGHSKVRFERESSERRHERVIFPLDDIVSK